jgi:hypothetical protein
MRNQYVKQLITPWLLLALPVAFLPLQLSGAVRNVTGASMGVGLTVSLIALGALLMVGISKDRGISSLFGSPSPIAVLGSALQAVLLGICFYRLAYNPDFGGLPNSYVGVDFGNHLLVYQSFVRDSPQTYLGFIAFHSLVYWYHQVIGHTLPPPQAMYTSVRCAIYTFYYVIPLALAISVYPTVARTSESVRRTVFVLLLSLPLQLCALWFLAFPIVHYLQADGFLAQIASFFPLLIGWITVGLCERAGVRLALCVFWLGALRFTYGLNLGDASIAAALFCWSEQRYITHRGLRWAYRAFVPAALLAGIFVYRELYPLQIKVGYFIDYFYEWTVPALIALSSILLVSARMLSTVGVAVAPASRRLWSYAACFGLVSGAVQAAYLYARLPVHYYFLKYGIVAPVMVSIACVGPVVALGEHAMRKGMSYRLRRESRYLRIGFVLALALTEVALAHGFEIYRYWAAENAFGKRPYRLIHSHYDSTAARFIHATLQTRGAQFGGYFDPFWPRMFVHNAIYNKFSSERDWKYNRAFERRDLTLPEMSGHCYFARGSADNYGGIDVPTGAQVQGILARKTACRYYRARWDGEPVVLCAMCLP